MGQKMAAVGGVGPKATLLARAQSGPAPQPHHPLATTRLTRATTRLRAPVSRGLPQVRPLASQSSREEREHGKA